LGEKKKKKYKIMNTKLDTKENIYLEWEKKSQQITNLKKSDKYHKHNSRKITLL
jgi:hypothetical protein